MIDYATEIANGATNDDLNAKYGTKFNYEAAISAGKTSADIDGYLTVKKATPVETAPITSTPETTSIVDTPEVIDYAKELYVGKTNDDLNAKYGTKFNYEAAIGAGKTTEDINEYLATKKQVASGALITSNLQKEKARDAIIREQGIKDLKAKRDSGELSYEDYTLQMRKLPRLAASNKQVTEDTADVMNRAQEQVNKQAFGVQVQPYKQEVQQYKTQQSGMEEASDIILDVLPQAAAGTAIGGGLYSMWKLNNRVGKKLRNVLKTKNDAQLKEYSDMLEYAKQNDIKLFDNIINGDVSAIKSSNLWAKEDIAKMVDIVESSEIKAANKIYKGQLKTFKELGEAFKTKAETVRAGYRTQENKLYKEASELGGKDKYDIRPIQSKIVELLRQNGAEQNVINGIKRELFHLDKTMGPEEKAIRKGLDAAKKSIKAIDKKLKTAEGNEVGRLVRQRNLAVVRKDKLKSKTDEFIDLNYLDADQLMNVVKRINSDIFTKGGRDWGSSDAMAKKFALDAREEVKKFIKTNKGEDSAFWKKYEEANAKSRERFGLFGAGDKGTKDFPELAKALHTENTDQLARGIIQSDSHFKLEMLQDTLGEDLGKDFITKYIDNTLELKPGKGMRQDELFQLDVANTEKLGANLNKLVGDQDNFNFIQKYYGADAAKDLKSLSMLTNGIADTMKALKNRKSELDKGVWDYIVKDGGLIQPVLRALQVAGQGVTHGLRTITGRQPYKQTKELGRVIKYLDNHLKGTNKKNIIERLRNFKESWKATGAEWDQKMQSGGYTNDEMGGAAGGGKPPEMPGKLRDKEMPYPKEKLKGVDVEDYIYSNDIDEALDDYSSDGFEGINTRYLQGYTNPQLEKLFEVEGNYNGISYRGVHLDIDKLKELQEGDAIQANMPLSSSKNQEFAEEYITLRQSGRDNVEKVVIEIDNFRNPQYDITPFATNTNEEEVLISPLSQLQVIDIDLTKTPKVLKVQLMHPEIQEIVAGKSYKTITNLMSLPVAAVGLTAIQKEEGN